MATSQSAKDLSREQPGLGLDLLIKQLRPKQWAKNLIIFAALLFSGKCTVAGASAAATLAFLAFCAVSSGVYIINDLIDVRADRAHPTKRLRPIASAV